MIKSFGHTSTRRNSENSAKRRNWKKESHVVYYRVPCSDSFAKFTAAFIQRFSVDLGIEIGYFGGPSGARTPNLLIKSEQNILESLNKHDIEGIWRALATTSVMSICYEAGSSSQLSL